MKALKARNEYLLAIDGANAAVQKYFVEDLPLLIEVGISHSYQSWDFTDFFYSAVWAWEPTTPSFRLIACCKNQNEGSFCISSFCILGRLGLLSRIAFFSLLFLFRRFFFVSFKLLGQDTNSKNA